jgi:hypothetical protein
MAAVPTQNCNTDLATQKAILEQLFLKREIEGDFWYVVVAEWVEQLKRYVGIPSARKFYHNRKCLIKLYIAGESDSSKLLLYTAHLWFLRKIFSFLFCHDHMFNKSCGGFFFHIHRNFVYVMFCTLEAEIQDGYRRRTNLTETSYIGMHSKNNQHRTKF